MGCATLQDRFESVFGTRRGVSRPVPCDPVSLAYAALRTRDLDFCLTVMKVTPDERAPIAAAKVDREVLELIRPNVFLLLANHAEMSSAAPGQMWLESLATRLRACARARAYRDNIALEIAHARSLGMSSVEANVDLSTILDDVIASRMRTKDDAVRMVNAYRSKIRRLSVAHGEVHDVMVRENIYKDLVEHGVNKLVINTL